MERPAVISESVARRLWTGQDPLGGKIREWEDKPPYLEVVGVVADVPIASLDGDSSMIVYQPLSERPRNDVSIVIRAAIDPASLASGVRDAVWSVDPQVPVPELKTMETLVSDSVSGRRFDMILVSLFGAIALALASMGVYGVVSYSVSQRTNEMGIRRALGAEDVQVRRLVVGQAMLPAALGLAGGPRGRGRAEPVAARHAL